MHREKPYILAIESSCDDTSVAVLHGSKVLSNITNTQQVHQNFGGVIPELASRSHEKSLIPVMHEALNKAEVDKDQIEVMAYTQGPGLPGSLIVGNAFAKSFSMVWDIPLISVNHMQAHILAHFIDDVHERKPEFPFLCLTVSGGHTQLVLVKDYLDMEVIGSTLDDAAGEAFDKVAKMIGLDYPGGPLVDKHAKEGDSSRFAFSKPRVEPFNFSFSGLKTSVLYFLRKEVEKDADFIEKNLNDICASVQKTVVDILMETLEKCAAHYGIADIAVAGGVSANSGLRKALKEREESRGWKTFVPPIQYCTDNAAMIGITAYFKNQRKEFDNLKATSKARMPF